MLRDVSALTGSLRGPFDRIERYLASRLRASAPPLVVSFPKSGRTWLRLMLDRLGIAAEYTHDGSAHRLSLPFAQLEPDKSKYEDRQIIYLLRDPRDVVVSGYFQSTKRIGLDKGDMSAFVKDERHGIEKIVRFNQAWLAAGPRMRKGFLLVRYEDLHRAPERELLRVVRFVRTRSISHQAIEDAVRFARFDNLQKLERTGVLGEKYGSILKPKRVDDPDSYKIRRGKIGGFVDYLNEQDIAFCTQTMQRLGFDRYPLD